MANKIKPYLDFIDLSVSELRFPVQPAQLYDPIRYILRPGGKRIRPVLALMACELFNSDFTKAKNAALAVELFHNFSLVHDDIMDKAPLRRGEATIHKKWSESVAILSGDALLIEAYKLLCTYDPSLSQQLLNLFNSTASEVCEGQQTDMDFEQKSVVPLSDYLEMIRLKTAVLLGCSLKMGALVGGASDTDANALYLFGVHLGVAFQLQDDLLDVYSDPSKFGKQVGGDIITNKKTYPLLRAFADSDETQKKDLTALLDEKDHGRKIEEVKHLYALLDIQAKTTHAMQQTYDQALSCLNAIGLPEEKKMPLRSLAGFLMQREF
jgi:geranylgeranyl diphosphate synthase, type II